MEQRYGDLIKAVYEDRPEYSTEVTITYRDGRQGKVSTTLKIQTMDS